MPCNCCELISTGSQLKLLLTLGNFGSGTVLASALSVVWVTNHDIFPVYYGRNCCLIEVPQVQEQKFCSKQHSVVVCLKMQCMCMLCNLLWIGLHFGSVVQLGYSAHWTCIPTSLIKTQLLTIGIHKSFAFVTPSGLHEQNKHKLLRLRILVLFYRGSLRHILTMWLTLCAVS